MAVCLDSVLSSGMLLIDCYSYNEPRRLAERRLVFNVDELKKAAAKSVNKPTSEIKSFSKFAEGGFNRVFDISM